MKMASQVKLTRWYLAHIQKVTLTVYKKLSSDARFLHFGLKVPYGLQ